MYGWVGGWLRTRDKAAQSPVQSLRDSVHACMYVWGVYSCARETTMSADQTPPNERTLTTVCVDTESDRQNRKWEWNVRCVSEGWSSGDNGR
jgi:hypothetical protein